MLSKRTLPALLVGLALSTTVPAQGMRQGGMGPGGPNRADMDVIHRLFDGHGKIRRTVKTLPNGVETLTESGDAQVAALLKKHVTAMKKRLEEGRPIRMWDPLFAAIFAQAPKITMRVTATERGIRVVETSDDAFAILLIQAHAKAVSGFAEKGWDAAHEAHPVPKTKNR